MRVKFYSHQNCSDCQMTRQTLIENEILFEEFDATDDPGIAKEYLNDAQQREFPLLVVDKDDGDHVVISGYHETEILQALDIEKY